MRKETYIINGVELTRVSKTRARQLWDEGKPVTYAAALVNLDSPWGLYQTSDKDFMECEFEGIVNHASHYMCNRECGMYLKYFERREVIA